MTDEELEATVRSAMHLDEKSVNYLPTLVGDATCRTWYVYINQQKVGEADEGLFTRLEELRAQIKLRARQPLRDFQIDSVSLVDKPLHGRTMLIVKKEATDDCAG